MADSRRVSIGSVDPLRSRPDILAAVDGGYFIPMLSNRINVSLTKISAISMTMNSFKRDSQYNYNHNVQFDDEDMTRTPSMSTTSTPMDNDDDDLCILRCTKLKNRTSNKRNTNMIINQRTGNQLDVLCFLISGFHSLHFMRFDIWCGCNTWVSIVYQSISNDQDPTAFASGLSFSGSVPNPIVDDLVAMHLDLISNTAQSGDTVISDSESHVTDHSDSIVSLISTLYSDLTLENSRQFE